MLSSEGLEGVMSEAQAMKEEMRSFTGPVPSLGLGWRSIGLKRARPGLNQPLKAKLKGTQALPRRLISTKKNRVLI